MTTITKTAVDPQTDLQPALFYASAREGMEDFLSAVLDNPQDGVLLPAFIGWSANEGSGVFDPVLNVGARAGFYGLHADLSVDVEALESMLETEKFRVLVVIHYFGRTDPRISELRELADRHGMLLVEDLAHGFYSSRGSSGAGSFGDMNLFSLHKMFPVSEGGMITYPRADLVTSQESTRPALAATILSYNWASIASARRHNFNATIELLRALPEHGTDFTLLWPELDGSDVPQTLPVRITGDNRDAIYRGMNEAGFGMVSLYHTLIAPVRNGFELENDLSRHIINFPVHQDVAAGALRALVASFQIYLHTK
jgi:dTDP-4-amino-4,6-dideoxygalactose transaminase